MKPDDSLTTLLAALSERVGRSTPGRWEHRGWEVYPSEHASSRSCTDGCDGGCDDDGPIVCEQVLHACEVIADVYGLQQFAHADGALIATLHNLAPALIAVLLVDEELTPHCPHGFPDGCRCAVCRGIEARNHLSSRLREELSR